MKVIACFATSLDGKIAPPDTPHYVRLGSDADIRHLQALREQVDAVVFGGETFRAYPRPHRGTHKDTVPLHVILTRSFNLPPQATYFRNHPPVPTVICSPQAAPDSIKSQYPEHIQWEVTGEANPTHAILQALKKRGIQSVLVEGGGQVMRLFLEAQAIEELYLTLCPLLLGGETTPSIISGPGFSLEAAPRTQSLSLKRVEQEVYLHLALSYPET